MAGRWRLAALREGTVWASLSRPPADSCSGRTASPVRAQPLRGPHRRDGPGCGPADIRSCVAVRSASGAAQPPGRHPELRSRRDVVTHRTVHPPSPGGCVAPPISTPSALQTAFQARYHTSQLEKLVRIPLPCELAKRTSGPTPGRPHPDTASHEGRPRSSDAAAGGGSRRPASLVRGPAEGS